MTGWRDAVIQFSPILFLSLAAAGSLTFLLIAEASGFEINFLLFLLPILGFLAIFAFYWNELNNHRLSGAFGTPLFAFVFLLSAILRLIVVFYANYYPDEYSTWSIFKLNPWGNVSEFLYGYDKIANPQIVHPPLAFLLMSLGYGLLHSVEGARLISVTFGLLSIAVVYWLMSLLTDRRAALYGSMVFSLLPQTIVFFSLALTDTFVLCFGLLALTTFVFAIKKRRRSYILASGVFLGLAFWSKASIPVLWAFTIFLPALFSGWISRKESIMQAFSCFIIGGMIYGLYYFISPISFGLSSGLLLRILSFGRFNIGPVISPLAGLPPIGNAQLSTISFSDLLLQLPAWFTPLILLFGAFEVFTSLRTRDRQTFWLVVWALIPLLAMVLYYRDIRYLLVSSVPIAMLALIGLRPASKRKVVLSTVFVFLAVASISFIPIVQQQYAGIRETSEVLSSLGLSDEVILTNAMPIRFYLPNAKLIYLSSYNSTESVRNLLISEYVAAAVVIHQRRGAWGGVPRPGVMELIYEYFGERIEGGPSAFSWYEVLYSSGSMSTPPPLHANFSDSSLAGNHKHNAHVQWSNSLELLSGKSAAGCIAILNKSCREWERVGN
jgi:4-amino-4-deoxy-L-arabinose transferase-like glycosyltransferase